MASGEAPRFDKVVFAAPPDQTLALLEDPTEAERRRFGAWRANHVHTLVHHDRNVHDRRGLELMTEFDVTETEPGKGGSKRVRSPQRSQSPSSWAAPRFRERYG